MTNNVFPRVLSVFLLGLLFFAANNYATTITGTLTNLNGNRWEVNYSVTNDTLGGPIEEFTIWFDLGLYDNLSVVSTPPDWDPLVIQPDPFIPDDGFYDALALISGISSSASLDGFTLAFDWLGSAAPTSQFFEVVDPFNFNVLDSGQTSLTVTDPTTPMPEPHSGILILTTLLLLILLRKQKILKTVTLDK